MSGIDDREGRICPFLTNHVTSGDSSNFTSTCSSVVNNCIYSETDWDGGIVFLECLESNCVFWNSDANDCVLYSFLNYLVNILSDTNSILSVLNSILNTENNILSDADNLLNLIKHFHNNHSHNKKHEVSDQSTEEDGDYFAGVPDATIKATEWLNQEDLDGDEEIYGETPLGSTEENPVIPVLESLKNHNLWPKEPMAPGGGSSSCEGTAPSAPEDGSSE